MPETLQINTAVTIISLVAMILSTLAMIRSKSSHTAGDTIVQKVAEKLIFEQEKIRRMDERIATMEEEIANLKDEIVQLQQKNEEQPRATESFPSSFLNSLQFHTFVQKNQELILLLQEGISVEQAAKLTGKSIGEAQMVRAVMKQMQETK